MYNTIGYGYSNGEEDVKKLQIKLNENGYNLDTDGIFGSKTQAAVKDYQQKNGLSVDGIVGKNTWGALTGSGSTATPEATDNSFKYDDYAESDIVKQAGTMYEQNMANKPGEYQYTWQDQLNDVINKINNREEFAYDLNGDLLYQQLKDQKVTQGKMAMMDAMGQAAALTGGYGSSFSQAVGQQAYQGQLQQLNDMIPELYNLALSKHQMEGDALYDQASALAQLMNQEYGMHRDKIEDQHWQAEFNASEDQRQKDNAYREEESKKPDLGVEKTKRMQAILGVEQTGLWDAATEEAAQALYGTSDPGKAYELWHNTVPSSYEGKLGGTDEENFNFVLSTMKTNHVPWPIMSQVLNPTHFQENKELSESYGGVYRLYLYDMLAYAYDQMK